MRFLGVFFKVCFDKGLISFMTSLTTLRTALAFPWQSVLCGSSCCLALSPTHGISLTFIMLATAKQKILLLANLAHISASAPLPSLACAAIYKSCSKKCSYASATTTWQPARTVGRERYRVSGEEWVGALGPSGAVATAPASGCHAYLSMPKNFYASRPRSPPSPLLLSKLSFLFLFRSSSVNTCTQTEPMAMPIRAQKSQPANHANC